MTARRFQVVAALGNGMSSVEVERLLLVPRSVIARIASVYLREGAVGLYDRRRNNGTPKVDARFRRRIAELLGTAPPDHGWQRPTWTRELLAKQMESEGFVRVAVCTIGRVLARLGARLGTPKPVVLCPWRRDVREARLAEIRRLEQRASAAEPVLYVDEVDINLNPKIGRDWMLPGTQRRIVTPGKNEKFYIAGALDVRTGRLHSSGGPSKSASLFCDLLERLASSYRRARTIHLVVDNYVIHSAAPTKRLLEQLRGRIKLHFLPPYCPQANRIERVWLDLHANVTRNHRCKTMKELLANARRYLEAYRWSRALARSAPNSLLRHAA